MCILFRHAHSILAASINKIFMRPAFDKSKSALIWWAAQFGINYTDYVSFFSASAAEAQTFAVNAGTHTQFIDDVGIAWLHDRPYQPGSWGYLEGKAVETHHRIFGTPHDPLYQTAREGMSVYRFDVPDGSYEIQIGLTEINYDKLEQRVFTVYANGSPLFTRLDLMQQYGRYFAVERTAQVQVKDGSGLTIHFEALQGSPIVSFFRIHKL